MLNSKKFLRSYAMRRLFLILLVVSVFLTTGAEAGLLDSVQNLLNKAGNIQNSRGAPSGISYTDKQNALKQALQFGVKYAISRLSKPGGYLNNPMVRIPLPKQVQPMAKLLRKIGQGEIVDRFEIAMNRAAEKAAPKTVNIFLNAIRHMSIQDVNRILLGGDNAATEYFKRKTYRALFRAIKPIVKETTSSTNVTRYYKQMLSIYDKYSSPIKSVSSFKSMLTGKKPSSNEPPRDLDNYITQKAIDGIFKMIAVEEKKIRNNPMARTTNLLRKVFGSIGR